MTEQEAIWRTISQAAKELSKSERTIRRWVDTGRLPTDRTRTPFAVDVSGEIPAQSTQEPSTTEVELLREMLDEVRADRDYLRQALATALSTQKLIEAPGARLSFRQWLGQVLGLPKRDSGDG